MADGFQPSAILDPPQLPPRFPIVIGRERNRAVRRKVFNAAKQPGDETGQMWKVTGDRDVTRFRPQSIVDPLRRIVWLDVARRSEFRQWIASTPECLSCLLRAQLAAVPDHRRSGTA